MDTKLGIGNLGEVLAHVKEVTKPYQLGIQLKIDSSELDTIEKNHPRDIDRQKTEVMKYWLRNSPVASWATLANAVEKMGGHSNLVEKLCSYPEKDQSLSLNCSPYPSYYPPGPYYLPYPTAIPTPRIEGLPAPGQSSQAAVIVQHVHVPRNILILGKREHGKSTLGNRLLNSDRYFGISDQPSQTRNGSAMLTSVSSNKTYKINVYDHNGLFEGFSSINALSSTLPGELHLVIIVQKYGRKLDESEQKILKGIMKKWQINQISALVLTHCESLSEEEKKKGIEKFDEDHPSIAKLMGKGILAVGFPDSSHIQPGSQLSQRVEENKKKLRYLIYSCDEQVLIPQLHSCCSIL